MTISKARNTSKRLGKAKSTYLFPFLCVQHQPLSLQRNVNKKQVKLLRLCKLLSSNRNPFDKVLAVVTTPSFFSLL